MVINLKWIEKKLQLKYLLNVWSMMDGMRWGNDGKE